MDPITHAVSGAVLAYSLPEHIRPQSKLFALFAGLMAAFPDIDVVFATSPINYLLLHRGITHSLIAVPFLAVLLAVLAFPLWINSKKKHAAAQAAQEQGEVPCSAVQRVPWTFTKTILLAAGCLLLHIWLDVVTTYGTMIFLPFSEYRVRLNGVFIVDILLTLTLILCMWHGSKFRPYAIMGLVWVLVYPSACVGIRAYHEAELRSQLQQENIVQEQGALVDVAVYPDAFAPYYWRAVYQTQKKYDNSTADAFTWPQGKSRIGYMFPSSHNTVYQYGFTLLGKIHSPLLSFPAFPQDLAQSLAAQSRRGRAFLDFTFMPIMEKKAMAPSEEELGVYDLRFSSMLLSIHEFISVRNKGKATFLLKTKRVVPSEQQGAMRHILSPQEPWQEVRLAFAGSGQDSGWLKPVKPISPSWWEKLVGIFY